MNGPVDRQLEAFNERNLEEFLEAHAPDALVEDGSGEEIIEDLHAEGFPEEAHAAVAYRVTDGEITLVRMFI